VIEPDEVPADEWQPMDPANSSPLVAWLASDDSQLITGQVLRSIHDRVIWMHGWHEAAEVAAGERRWDAAELGRVLATDVFRVATPGLRFL
jgi:two-component sensor histidine kinase